MLIKLAHFVTYYVLNVLLGSGVYVSSYLKFTSEIAGCNPVLKRTFVEKRHDCHVGAAVSIVEAQAVQQPQLP